MKGLVLDYRHFHRFIILGLLAELLTIEKWKNFQAIFSHFLFSDQVMTHSSKKNGSDMLAK
jgi:hypothetical protein